MSWIERIHERFVVGRRARVLAQHLAELLPRDASVLDVGCGDGQIAQRVALQRPDLQIRGVDVLVREQTAIPVEPFDGRRLPFEDRAIEVVMFIDVLHHTDDPRVLLAEAARVARQAVVVKDHLREGFLAGYTLRFMDRVGNRRHGVALPHTYLRRNEWRGMLAAIGVTVETWSERLQLYGPWAGWLFDRSLHFIARLAVQEVGSAPSAEHPGNEEAGHV